MYLFQVKRQEKAGDEVEDRELWQVRGEPEKSTEASPDEHNGHTGGPEASAPGEEEDPRKPTYVNNGKVGSPLTGEVLPGWEAEGTSELPEDQPEKPQVDLAPQDAMEEAESDFPKVGSRVSATTADVPVTQPGDTQVEAENNSPTVTDPDEGEPVAPRGEAADSPTGGIPAAGEMALADEGEGFPWIPLALVGGVLLLGLVARPRSVPQLGQNSRVGSRPSSTSTLVAQRYPTVTGVAAGEDPRYLRLPPLLRAAVDRGDLRLDQVVGVG